MINRLLIRIKALQVLYNYLLVDTVTAEQAMSIYSLAIEHSYRLYIYLCGLPLHLQKAAREKIEVEKSKLSPNQELITLYRTIAHNPLTVALEKDDSFVEKLDLYTPERNGLKQYYDRVVLEIARENVDLAADPQTLTLSFWNSIYKKYFFSNENYHSLLEGYSAYILDDIEIVTTFVRKVINGLANGAPLQEVIRPMYGSEAEKKFGEELLWNAIQHEKEYKNYLSNYFKNWDKDRVSEMDYLILLLAMTEAIHNPQIATQVTINEYLNLARYYSTPNSTFFINGILHRAFTDLKAEGKILGE